jgi:hypothetical protein
MTNETKLIVVVIALYLWWHWRNMRVSLATGQTGAPGNSTPGYSSVGGQAWDGPGNRHDNTWGSW